MYQSTTALQKIAALSKKIRALQGGTSSSKTISSILYLVHRCQSDVKATLSSIISESVPHLKRGAMRDFKNIMIAHKYWNDDRWNATDSIYTFETGSQLEFFSADNSSKLRGGRRDRAFINECNNISLEAFDEIEVRTKEFVILDWNPTSHFWFYDLINPASESYRADIEHIILTYRDNEGLSKEIVSSIEARRNRKGWWRVYGEGLLGEVEGKIYKDWAIIDDVPHEARIERYGMDFGYSNDPTSILAIYYYNGGYILDEITFQKGLSNRQIADILLGERRELVVADSAEPKSIDEIASYGISIIGAEKGADSLRNGIQVVQDLRISITKRSSNVIKEYRNYLWKTDKDGNILNVPESGFDHAMDAARYGLISLVANRADPFAMMKVMQKRESKNLAYE